MIFQRQGILPDEFVKFPEWKKTFVMESTRYQMELDANQQVLGSGGGGDFD